MAQASLNEGPKPSILSLEKSTAPFETQIDIACQHLGISLGKSPSELEAEEKLLLEGLPIRSEPRVDYAIRWLLKHIGSYKKPLRKERGANGQASQPSEDTPWLNGRAWTLLRALTFRTSTSNVARLFKEHKFLDSLEFALSCVADRELDTLIQPLSNGSLARKDGQTSSSDDTPIALPKENRKRKRGQEDPENQSHTRMSVYLAICRLLRSLDYMIENRPKHVPGFYMDHLEVALSPSPEQAAKLVGLSIRFADTGGGFGQTENQDDQNVSCQGLECFLAMWDRASEVREGAERVKVHLHFARSCMLPMLDHLSKLAELTRQSSDPLLTSWVKRIEKIIIKNVILPAREAYLNANRPTKTRDQILPDTLVADLLEPLRKPCNELSIKEGSDEHRRVIRATAHHVAILFGFAADNPQRDTPKQKAAESIWLQRLFSMLIEINISYDAENSGNLDAGRHSCLHPILSVALEKDVRVEQATLTELLHRHSGLFAAGSNVDWGLINICIRIDPSLWIDASFSAVETPEADANTSGSLLTGLLAKLSGQQDEVLLDGKSQQYNLLESVIFPLLDAFVKNRRLTDFIELWQKRIALAQEKGSARSDACIWENERLLRYISSVIESNLTYAQVRSIIDQYSDKLSESNELAISSTRKAALVILDGVFSANYGQRALEENSASVNRLYDTLLAIVLKHSYETSERAWKLITIIRERWRSTKNFTETEHGALHRACDLTASHATATSQIPIWACRFALSSIQHVIPGSPAEGSDTYKALTKAAVDFLQSLQLPGSREKAPQDVAKFGIDATTANQYVPLLFATLIFAPGALEVLPLEVRSTCFDALYNVADSATHDERDIKHSAVPILRLWEIAQNQVSKEYSRKVLDTFATIVATKLCDEKAAQGKSLAIQTIPSIPIAHLPKSVRTKVSSRLCQLILASEKNKTSIVDALRALSEFSQQRPNSLEIFSILPGCEDKDAPVTIFAIAARLDRNRASSMTFIEGIGYLRKITSVELHSLKRDRQHEEAFFHSLLNVVKRAIEGLSKKLHRSYATLAVVDVCLSYLATHAQGASQQKQEDIYNMRTHSLHLIQEQLIQRIDPQDASSHNGLHILLDCLSCYADIIQQQEKVRCDLCGYATRSSQLVDFLRHFSVDDLARTPSVPQDPSQTGQIDIRSKMNTVLMDICKTPQASGSFPIPMQGLKRAARFQARHRLLKCWRCKVERSANAIEDALRLIINELKDEEFVHVEPIYVLQSLLLLGTCFSKQTKTVPQHDKDNEDDGEIPKDKETFTRLLNAVCNTAAKTSDAPMCITSLRCINTMLRSRTHMITQWHIDSVMACIAITASHIKLRHNPKAACHIHVALTRVFGSILAAHRLRLGGRFHMVLLALKALLICLFTPFDPPKDLPSYIDHSHTFTAIHAENLSRILSSICDPTVSAVSHRRTHQSPHGALNDETKKARSEAGRHMLYFIMDYCVLQLSAHMVGEGMRERLLPGIWAVLNVMSRDIMGAMNAQLGPQGREIWRELYAEWRREGRGREEG